MLLALEPHRRAHGDPRAPPHPEHQETLAGFREQEALVAQQREARVGRAVLGRPEDLAHLLEIRIVVAGDLGGGRGGEQAPEPQHEQKHPRPHRRADGAAGIVAHDLERLLVAIVDVVEQPPAQEARAHQHQEGRDQPARRDLHAGQPRGAREGFAQGQEDRAKAQEDHGLLPVDALEEGQDGGRQAEGHARAPGRVEAPVQAESGQHQGQAQQAGQEVADLDQQGRRPAHQPGEALGIGGGGAGDEQHGAASQGQSRRYRRRDLQHCRLELTQPKHSVPAAIPVGTDYSGFPARDRSSRARSAGDDPSLKPGAARSAFLFGTKGFAGLEPVDQAPSNTLHSEQLIKSPISCM